MFRKIKKVHIPIVDASVNNSQTAYISVPNNHPLACKQYVHIDEIVAYIVNKVSALNF